MNSSTHSNLTVAPGRYDDADGGGCGVDESALGSPRYSASSIAGVFGLACGINADVGSCDESDNCAWDVASSACGVSDGITATITGLLAAARAPAGATCTADDSSAFVRVSADPDASEPDGCNGSMCPLIGVLSAGCLSCLFNEPPPPPPSMDEIVASCGDELAACTGYDQPGGSCGFSVDDATQASSSYCSNDGCSVRTPLLRCTSALQGAANAAARTALEDFCMAGPADPDAGAAAATPAQVSHAVRVAGCAPLLLAGLALAAAQQMV